MLYYYERNSNKNHIPLDKDHAFKDHKSKLGVCLSIKNIMHLDGRNK